MRLRPGTDTSCERKLRICDKKKPHATPSALPKARQQHPSFGIQFEHLILLLSPRAPKSAANAAFRARNTLKKQEAPLFRAEAKIRKVDQALGFPLLSNMQSPPRPPGPAIPPGPGHQARARRLQRPPRSPSTSPSPGTSRRTRAMATRWQPAQTKRLTLGYGQREGNVAKPGGRHKTATNFRGLVAKPWNNHLPTRMSGWRKAGLAFGTRFPCLSTDNNWMKTDGVRYRRAIILSPSVCLLKRLRSGHGEIGGRKSG